MFLLIVNKFFSCDLCYVKDVRLSAIWLVSAFCVSLVAVLVPCVMSGFMEMFGPQGSVGFMCVISLFCLGHLFLDVFFVVSFVFIS